MLLDHGKSAAAELLLHGTNRNNLVSNTRIRPSWLPLPMKQKISNLPLDLILSSAGSHNTQRVAKSLALDWSVNALSNGNKGAAIDFMNASNCNFSSRLSLELALNSEQDQMQSILSTLAQRNDATGILAKFVLRSKNKMSMSESNQTDYTLIHSTSASFRDFSKYSVKTEKSISEADFVDSGKIWNAPLKDENHIW